MERDQWDLKIKLPVTLGFLDFKIRDIDNTGLPDDVTTASFVPGIEYLYPVNPNWSVIPFIDAGIARNYTTDESVYVYSGGIKHRLVFNQGNKLYTVGYKLLYAAHTGEAVNGSDNLRILRIVLGIPF